MTPGQKRLQTGERVALVLHWSEFKIKVLPIILEQAASPLIYEESEKCFRPHFLSFKQSRGVSSLSAPVKLKGPKLSIA